MSAKARRERFRFLVRTIEDLSVQRIKADNRRGTKKNGQPIAGREDPVDNLTPAEIHDLHSFLNFMEQNAEELKRLEDVAQRKIEELLKQEPLWNEFLKDVKGCGPKMAAWILSEFDIEKATTVSKMIQYCGMNPGLVRGKKVVKITKANKKDNFVKVYKNMKGEECGIVETDELIRGDKLTPGFVSPFNKKLRTKMLGVLGGSFLKTKSPYSKFYYDYKNRLEQSENLVMHSGKMTAWKDVNDMHRHQASMRYMMKMFFHDLYRNWRQIEGLPVRCPYEEEYLGREHHTA